MAIDTKHPLYIARAPEWEQMRDTYAGERQVKAAGSKYLPPTSGMIEDGYPVTSAKGTKDYEAYRTRARCPDLVDEAVSALMGVMHSKPPTITLPTRMEYLRTAASARGESIETLLKRINFEQMVAGRVGLLGDVIDVGPRANEVYIATYTAEDILNWDDATRTDLEVESLNLVVLDESADQREPGKFTWKIEHRYRVLTLGGLDKLDVDGEATYRFAIVGDDRQFSAGLLTEASVRGRRLTEIPFVFVNAEDVAAEPGKPPLLGLSNLVLGIYRGEADYRQSLFMQGQDTLVLTGIAPEPEDGSDSTLRLGVGAVLRVPDPSGDAKFIGVDSNGLPEQRTALDNDYGRGEQFAGRLMDSVTRERESGDALRIRLATRTATLNQIALAGAYGLERILKSLARWVGEDPDEVSVVPNLDFVDDQMTGTQLKSLMEAKMQGAPVSLKTIHTVMSKRSMTEMDYETEIAQIIEETPVLNALQTMAPEPTGPADPNQSQQ